LKGLKGIFYGYWILLICVILHAMGSGEFFYGFSVFYTPILVEFGWSSAVTAGAFSLSRLEGGLEGPIIGWAVDKYGPKKLLLFGIIFTGLGFIAMTQVRSILLLYVIYGGVLSIGYNTGFTHAMTSLIARWFINMRSRAMGIYALSAGVGGAAIVPLLARAINSYGWRTAAVICGLSYWIIGIPLWFFVKNRPENLGLLPDGINPQELDIQVPSGSSGSLNLEVEMTTMEALRSSTFWKLMLAESLRSFLLGSVVLHQIPYLVSIGIEQATAANILGLMITLSIPGRLVFGTLGDFYSKRWLLTIAMTLQAVGIFIFSQATSLLYVYAFVLIYGISYGGAVPLRMSFHGELFGRKRFATISGALAPFTMIGSIFGPIAAGYIFDIYGSYKLAFYIFTVLAALSAVAFALVNPPDRNNKK
jgi:sugar phosphate permease